MMPPESRVPVEYIGGPKDGDDYPRPGDVKWYMPTRYYGWLHEYRAVAVSDRIHFVYFGPVPYPVR